MKQEEEQPKTGWTWTLAGVFAGLLIIPLGMFGGNFGQIILGAFGMGAAGVLIYGIIPLARAQFEPGWLNGFSTWLGALAGLAGFVVGAFMGADGERFEWWIWPLATLGAMALGVVVGSWTYRMWLYRQERKNVISD